MTDQPRNYWCFISYSHADNRDYGRKWATWLQKLIETYEIPPSLVGITNKSGDVLPDWIKPVFRDKDELAVDADLASAIYKALDNSKYLIVLCSPRSAASDYVAQEILYFKKLGRSNRVLAVVIDGAPNSSRNPAGSGMDECLPKPLLHPVDASGTIIESEYIEPIWADFRLNSSVQGWTSPKIYRRALTKIGGLSRRQISETVKAYSDQCELTKLQILAGILGIQLSTLTERDNAYQLESAAKRDRNFRLVASAIAILALITIGASYFAWKKSDENKIALANKLFVQSNANIPKNPNPQSGQTSDPDLALFYAARALGYSLDFAQGYGLSASLLLRTKLEQINLVSVLEHDSYVQKVSFSPDGLRVVTASFGNGVLLSPSESSDKAARLWDIKTGKSLGKPMIHKGNVNYVAFSPDGRRIVTASDDYSARIWNASTGIPLGEPMQHESSIHYVNFSPDSRLIVTASDDFSARIWDAETGKPLGQPLQHAHYVRHASFRFDGRQIVTASWDKTARVWDSETSKPVGNVIKHEGPVNSAEFSPDGRSVLTASEDNTARVWDAASGVPISQPMQHSDAVLTAVFSPGGWQIVTGSSDFTARIWDAKTGKPWVDWSGNTAQIMQHDAQIWSATFNPSGTEIVTASADGNARLWDAATGKLLGKVMKHDGSVLDAVFSPDGSHVATASDDKTVRIWEINPRQSTDKLANKIEKEFASYAKFSPNSHELRLILISGNSAKLWDAKTTESLGETIRHGDRILQAEFSIDGQRVVTASLDHTARVWDAASGRPISGPLQHRNFVLNARLSMDGKRVITVSRFDTNALLWDSETGKTLGEPLHHENYINYAAFSPDGRLVVTASEDNTTRLWDGQTGRPLSDPMRHEGRVEYAEFSPNGRHIVTIAYNTVELWDVSTAKRLGEPMQHESFVRYAAFSPDGRRLVTASDDHFARVWDVDTGQPIGEPMLHEGKVFNAAFSPPDGRIIVTASSDNIVRFWDAKSGKLIGNPIQHEGLTSAEFSPDGRKVIVMSPVRILEAPYIFSKYDKSLPDFMEFVSGFIANDKDGTDIQKRRKPISRIDISEKLDSLKEITPETRNYIKKLVLLQTNDSP